MLKQSSRILLCPPLLYRHAVEPWGLFFLTLDEIYIRDVVLYDMYIIVRSNHKELQMELASNMSSLMNLYQSWIVCLKGKGENEWIGRDWDWWFICGVLEVVQWCGVCWNAEWCLIHTWFSSPLSSALSPLCTLSVPSLCPIHHFVPPLLSFQTNTPLNVNIT